MHNPDFFTCKEIAERFHLSPSGVTKACVDKRITATKRLNHTNRPVWVVTPEEVERITPLIDTLFSRGHGQRQHIPCPVSPARLEEIYYAARSLKDAAQAITQTIGVQATEKNVRRWMSDANVPTRSLSAAAKIRFRTPEGKQHLKTLVQQGNAANRAKEFSQMPPALAAPAVRNKAIANRHRSTKEDHWLRLECPICHCLFERRAGQVAARRRECGDPDAPVYCGKSCGAKGGHATRKQREEAE